MFSLAHITDLHLGPLPVPGLGELRGKRMIGYLSWRLRRLKVHHPRVLAAVMTDIAGHAPDHIAVTGDLANISLPGEFVRARQWLEMAGPPERITVVPGNHDAYVGVPWETGIGLWGDYMTGDMRFPAGAAPSSPFPFVRQRRNIALIGLSSAVPAALNRASGRLGTRQIEALAVILSDLRKRGFCRVVLIHHPPLPGQSPRRKALEDAAEVQAVLQAEGAELVLHGHNHMHMRTILASRHGPVPVMGATSASALAKGHKPAAAWYLYRIRRQAGVWRIEVLVRSWNEIAGAMVDETSFHLGAEADAFPGGDLVTARP
jgi:3',5'-cyclic AMP phosphodiesterase CpdA